MGTIKVMYEDGTFVMYDLDIDTTNQTWSADITLEP